VEESGLGPGPGPHTDAKRYFVELILTVLGSV